MCKWYDAEKNLMKVNLVCENFEIAHFKCVFDFIEGGLLYCDEKNLMKILLMMMMCYLAMMISQKKMFTMLS